MSERDHLTMQCPRVPIVKAIWQDNALYGVMIPQPNRMYLRRDPHEHGFYKLEAETIHDRPNE